MVRNVPTGRSSEIREVYGYETSRGCQGPLVAPHEPDEPGRSSSLLGLRVRRMALIGLDLRLWAELRRCETLIDDRGAGDATDAPAAA